MSEELASALRGLLRKVTDIRGVDIEGFYAPEEVRNALYVLDKFENLKNTQENKND